MQRKHEMRTNDKLDVQNKKLNKSSLSLKYNLRSS